MEPESPCGSDLNPPSPTSSELGGELATNLKIERLRGEIHEFLNRGVDGATLSIRAAKSGHLIVFRKYILEKNNYGLKIIFGSQDQNSDLTKIIGEYCAERNIEFQIIGEKDPTHYRTISIECGKDIDTAYNIFVHIVRNVICLPSGCKFDLDSSGMSPWKEIIHSPDQLPASREEGIRLTRDWNRRMSGTDGLGVLVYIFLRFSQLSGTLGILVTLVFAWDSWEFGRPPVSDSPGDVPFSGMISIALAAIGFLVIFTPTFWRVPSRDRVKGMLPVPKTPRSMLIHFFGQPINWATIVALAFAAYAWF